MPLALLPAALVDVSRGGVDDSALAALVVGLPVARVDVAVGVGHGSGAGPERGGVGACVGVAVHVDGVAGSVGAAACEGAGEVGAGEVGGCEGAGDAVGGVDEGVEVVEVGGWGGEVAAAFDDCGAGVAGVSLRGGVELGWGMRGLTLLLWG